MCPHARRGFFRSQNSAPRDSSAAKMATYEPAGWIYEPAGWIYEPAGWIYEPARWILCVFM